MVGHSCLLLLFLPDFGLDEYMKLLLVWFGEKMKMMKKCLVTVNELLLQDKFLQLWPNLTFGHPSLFSHL